MLWTLTHYTAHGPVRGSCGHRHSTFAAAKSCAKRLRRRDSRTRAEPVGVWTNERGTERLDTAEVACCPSCTDAMKEATG